MENDERAEAIKAGQARAAANGKQVGRPKVIFDRVQVVKLRDEEGLSWAKIAAKLGVSIGTVRRVYKAAKTSAPGASSNGAGQLRIENHREARRGQFGALE